MVTEPALEPTHIEREEDDDDDEGEESDVYELEGEEEGDAYQPEEDEDDDGEEETGEVVPENMTALLLGKQNGTARSEEEEEEEEDYEYQENGENTAVPLVVAGSKRGVDELSEEDGSGDEDGDEPAENTKKARV